jgi:hypothetical protein
MVTMSGINPGRSTPLSSVTILTPPGLSMRKLA